MIKVFKKTDKDFSSNGDVVLRATKAKLHKEDNGDYYITIETGIEYSDYLINGNLIVVDTPQGEQAFRISNPSKTGKKITIKAWHVFYDSENYLIADSYVVDMNCNNALDHLNRATEPSSEFTTLSDVTTVDSYRCVRKSLYEAIQTVIERWGGHLVRDNFNIQIRQTIGNDNGVTVRYKKNLKELTYEENWDSVVTKLLPVGKDGLLLNDQDANASIYVESAKQYEIPYTKKVSFSQDSINEEDYKTSDGKEDTAAYHKALVEDLRTQAQAYVDTNCVPKVNYTLKANVEKLTDIGDTIEVIDERLGLDLLTNVIGFEYDLILEKYTEIEFGNFKQTLSNFASSITSQAQSTAKKTVSEVTHNIPDIVTTSITNLLSENGIIMYAKNGGYVVLNQNVGLVGYDSLGNPLYWATNDEFHMTKATIENEITLCNKLRFIPMTISDNSNVCDGIGLVATYSSDEEVI